MSLSHHHNFILKLGGVGNHHSKNQRSLAFFYYLKFNLVAQLKKFQLILWRTKKQKGSPRMASSFLKIKLNHLKIANRKPGWSYLMPFCSTDSSFKGNVQDRHNFSWHYIALPIFTFYHFMPFNALLLIEPAYFALICQYVYSSKYTQSILKVSSWSWFVK